MNKSNAGAVQASTRTEPHSRRVLNVGCGHARAGKLHPGFDARRWSEVRLDIDPGAKPDLLGSVLDLGDIAPDGSFDAVWCSHVLEHLDGHDVVPALVACCRVLKPDGFVLVTSPDLTAVAQRIVSADLEEPAYQSPSGPISALDMLFGHGAAVQAGRHYMAHRTGFTADRLGRLSTEAGFAEARVAAGTAFDLWALLTLPGADPQRIEAIFEGTNVARLLF